jgi:nitrate reductase alpha subunit
VRARLLRAWRAARQTMSPVAAWRAIVQQPDMRAGWVSRRGRCGLVRAGWDEVTELIAAANAYTIREYGPDRIAGFSPIPAMSMISYAAGSRYLSLIGGNLLSFYDWYCDLPPSSPQTWGEQTDVPESADWYNSGFLLVWGSNIPQARSPDAHFYTEARPTTRVRKEARRWRASPSISARSGRSGPSSGQSPPSSWSCWPSTSSSAEPRRDVASREPVTRTGERRTLCGRRPVLS